MEPHVYIGRAGTGKTWACFKEIERILQDHPEHQIILLVPDPATYMMEDYTLGIPSVSILGACERTWAVGHGP